jgi:RecA-family ATPase
MAAPYATVHAGDLARRTAPLSWIVEGLFLEAGAGILGGAPKSYKSFFALDLCVAVASATSCAGAFRVLKPGPVVVLCAEDPDAVISERLVALSRARGRELGELPIEILVDPVRLPEGIERLEATLAAFTPRLLLLDPLIRLHRADENSASEMSVILDGLRRLARNSKTAILLVHHARKAAAGNGGAGLRGSSDLHAFGDSNLYLRKLSQDSTLELKIEHRAAAAPAPVRLKLKVDNRSEPSACFEIVDGAQQDDPAARRILDLLGKADAPLSSAALREKLGVRNQTVAEALKLLQANGRIQRAGRDGWSAAAD